MKFENLHQEHDAEAPYADRIVLDSGGMNIDLGGEPLAYVSFEGLDPFELAFHAMPDDWEPHEVFEGEGVFSILTVEEHCENGIYGMLKKLGKLKGWERN